MKDDFKSRLPSLAERIELKVPRSQIQDEYFDNFGKYQEEIQRRREHESLEKKQYEKETLETLKKIEKNTGDLSQIIDLLQTSTARQEEVLSLLTEIHKIAISKSEEEADSRYREIMRKITELEEDVTAVDTLLGYAKMVWYGVKSILKSNGVDLE